jgi:hypothetical protein
MPRVDQLAFSARFARSAMSSVSNLPAYQTAVHLDSTGAPSVRQAPARMSVVAGRGALTGRRSRPSMPVFQVPGVRMAILIRQDIVPLLVERGFPPNVELVALPLRSDGTFSAAAVLAAVERFQHAELVLCNAGPRFMAHMIAERSLDEFFLTVAPQVAGRDGSSDRPGFVDGKVFAPTEPRGAELVSVKRASNHLFLRYALQV